MFYCPQFGEFIQTDFLIILVQIGDSRGRVINIHYGRHPPLTRIDCTSTDHLNMIIGPGVYLTIVNTDFCHAYYNTRP